MRACSTGLALLVALAGCDRAREPRRVEIPAATLVLGCAPERDASCAETERPARPVRVGAFRIDETEVTQGAYERCVEARACRRPPASYDPSREARRPVVEVAWSDARMFCAWAGGRLPTEAEWELAARGTDGRVFPWGDAAPTCDRAHLRDCGAAPAEVGGRRAGASPYGVLDLAGNVDEWVEDAYAPYGGAATSGERVARGGAYDAWHARATARSALAPSHRDPWLGFRCAY